MDLLERELLPRKTLKNLFKKGSFPRESYFVALIDSTVNIVDDGLSKNAEDGLKISPLGASEKLLSFYENIQDKHPSWHIALNPDKSNKGLSITESGTEPGSDKSRLYIQKGGNIGIGTTQPDFKLEVKGVIGSEGRLGTFKHGKIPADGNWYTIFDLGEELSGNNAFEIMAYVESKIMDSNDEKKFHYQRSLLHATAVCSFGKGGLGTIRKTRFSMKPPIRKTFSSQGMWYLFGAHKIKVKWSNWNAEKGTYNLEMKTGVNYGVDSEGKQRQITYRIAKLWDEDNDPLFAGEDNDI